MTCDGQRGKERMTALSRQRLTWDGPRGREWMTALSRQRRGWRDGSIAEDKSDLMVVSQCPCNCLNSTAVGVHMASQKFPRRKGDVCTAYSDWRCFLIIDVLGGHGITGTPTPCFWRTFLESFCSESGRVAPTSIIMQICNVFIFKFGTFWGPVTMQFFFWSTNRQTNYFLHNRIH